MDNTQTIASKLCSLLVDMVLRDATKEELINTITVSRLIVDGELDYETNNYILKMRQQYQFVDMLKEDVLDIIKEATHNE